MPTAAEVSSNVWKPKVEPARAIKPKERFGPLTPKEMDVNLTSFYLIFQKAKQSKSISKREEALLNALDKTGKLQVHQELAQVSELTSLAHEPVDEQGNFEKGGWQLGSQIYLTEDPSLPGHYIIVRPSERAKVAVGELLTVSQIQKRNGEKFSCTVNGQTNIPVDIDIDTIVEAQVVNSYDAAVARRKTLKPEQMKDGNDGIFTQDEFDLLEAHVESTLGGNHEKAEQFKAETLQKLGEASGLVSADSVRIFREQN